MTDWNNLRAIGYQITGGEGTAPRIINPDGRVVCNPAAQLRLAHIAGRLENVAYMAHYFDLLDRAEQPAAPVSGGKQQFLHMAKSSDEHLRTALQLYFALRRLQRSGDLRRLRTGLTILLAHDHDEISDDDAMDAMKLLCPENPAMAFGEDLTITDMRVSNGATALLA